MWQALLDRNRGHLEEVVVAESRAPKAHFVEHTENLAGALRRMGSRLESGQSETAWITDTQHYAEDLDCVEWVAHVDSKGRPVEVIGSRKPSTP